MSSGDKTYRVDAGARRVRVTRSDERSASTALGSRRCTGRGRVRAPRHRRSSRRPRTPTTSRWRRHDSSNGIETVCAAARWDGRRSTSWGAVGRRRPGLARSPCGSPPPAPRDAGRVQVWPCGAPDRDQVAVTYEAVGGKCRLVDGAGTGHGADLRGRHHRPRRARRRPARLLHLLRCRHQSSAIGLRHGRLVDSSTGLGWSTGRLESGTTRTVQIAGRRGSPGGDPYRAGQRRADQPDPTPRR